MALPMLERNPWQLWLNGDKSLHDSARVAYKQYVQENTPPKQERQSSIGGGKQAAEAAGLRSRCPG